MVRPSIVVLALALAPTLTGVACGSGRPSPDEFVRVPHGEITTPGVVIEDEADRFRLVAGSPFRTPFWSYDCPAHPTIENHAFAERLGAQRVRVFHPSYGWLHGLLSLCMVHPISAGPVRRSYAIQVPDSYVADTEGDRVSMVWEPTDVSEGFADGRWALPGWILWLSRRPFSER